MSLYGSGKITNMPTAIQQPSQEVFVAWYYFSKHIWSGRSESVVEMGWWLIFFCQTPISFQSAGPKLQDTQCNQKPYSLGIADRDARNLRKTFARMTLGVPLRSLGKSHAFLRQSLKVCDYTILLLRELSASWGSLRSKVGKCWWQLFRLVNVVV